MVCLVFLNRIFNLYDGLTKISAHAIVFFSNQNFQLGSF